MTKQYLSPNIVEGVEIELTNHCTLNCITCARKKRNDFGFMDYATFIKTIDFIRAKKCHEIFLSGHGDVFLHQELFKMINYIFKKYPRVNIVIPTKGQTIDSKILKRIKKLQERQFSITLCFSVFSLNHKTYKFLTGGSFKHFMSVVKQAVDLNLNYTLEFLLTGYNIDEFQKFQSFARSLNIRNYGLALVHHWKGAMTEKEHQKFFNAKTAKFLKQRRASELCEVFQYPAYVFVDYKGKIHLCSNGVDDSDVLGDVFHGSFQNILRKKRRLNRKKICSRCFMHDHVVFWDINEQYCL